MKAFIIDDMELSRQSLTYTLNTYFPEITIVGESGDFTESVLTLQRKEVDLLFLDMNLGDNFTGFQLLDRLTNFKGDIIVITAYDQYAVKAFKYNVSNFIMKPIDVLDLAQAINKIKEANSKKTFQQPFEIENLNNKQISLPNSDIQNKTNVDKISLPYRNGLELICVEDIIYLQGSGSYTNVYVTNDKKFRIAKNLKFVLGRLKNYPNIIRVQKSYAVNKNCITGFIRSEGGLLELNGEIKIPVSILYKEEILKLFP